MTHKSCRNDNCTFINLISSNGFITSKNIFLQMKLKGIRINIKFETRTIVFKNSEPVFYKLYFMAEVLCLIFSEAGEKSGFFFYMKSLSIKHHVIQWPVCAIHAV